MTHYEPVFILMDQHGEPVQVGQTLTSFRGEEAVFIRCIPPRENSPSTGRVIVKDRFGMEREFYPSVFDLYWLKHIPHD